MTRDHHQPNDHAAWSTPSPGPAPWSSTTPATYSGRACGGLVSTCSVSCSPANRPAPWRWTSVPCRPGGEEARSRCAGEAAVWAAVEPACEPGTANAAPSLPVRSGSGRRPSRPRTAARRTGCAQGGGPLTEPFQGPARHRQRGCRARTPEAFPSGHLGGTGCVDTGRVDTGRRLDRSDGRPHGGQRTRTRPRPAWPASGHPGDRRPPAGRPNSSGSQRLGRSATQDGSAVTTPAPRP
jgi:hypothetical protein